MKKRIQEMLNDSIRVKQQVIESQLGNIETAARKIIQCYRKGGKLLLFGNGGSAADAQHIAAELVHKFELEHRKALPAIALGVNSSVITAIGNDWSYDDVFSRQVEALAKKDDVVMGISTSGNSKNVQQALVKAKDIGVFTIGLLGKDGGSIKDCADCSVIVPAKSTARIQESHITIGHILCHLVEQELFSKKDK